MSAVDPKLPVTNGGYREGWLLTAIDIGGGVRTGDMQKPGRRSPVRGHACASSGSVTDFSGAALWPEPEGDGLKAGMFFSELKRCNVLCAVAIYVAAVWALTQGISQLAPSVGLPDWTTRWFLVVAIIGFPFWIALAWCYELTPTGF